MQVTNLLLGEIHDHIGFTVEIIIYGDDGEIRGILMNLIEKIQHKSEDNDLVHYDIMFHL